VASWGAAHRIDIDPNSKLLQLKTENDSLQISMAVGV
jgi:hypothetical protein